VTEQNNYVSILLDIKEEVGSLNARMMEATHSRERMERHITELKDSVFEIKPVVQVVATMKPEHDDLMKFRDRVGGYVWLAGVMATGALYLLWHGLSFFSENIKSAFGRIFH
jgi:hypothetical protein